jgi:sigma-E factor negative regulatory protein RseB
MPMRALRLFLLGTCFVSLPGWAQDATAWMARMGEALATLDYQGDLVYQHGSQLETLRIYHASGTDGGRERLLTLSGAPREVIRGGGQVRCVGTSDQSTSYGHGMLQSPLMAPFGGAGAASLGRHYEAVLGGVERIAEHETQLVEVRPRDAFRYGYRFWLERNSGMPLKSLRFGADGRPGGTTHVHPRHPGRAPQAMPIWDRTWRKPRLVWRWTCRRRWKHAWLRVGPCLIHQPVFG